MEDLVVSRGRGVYLKTGVLDEELFLGEVRELSETRSVLEPLVIILNLHEVLKEDLESVLSLGRGSVNFSELGLPGLECRHDRSVLFRGGDCFVHGGEEDEARGDHGDGDDSDDAFHFDL